MKKAIMFFSTMFLLVPFVALAEPVIGTNSGVFVAPTGPDDMVVSGVLTSRLEWGVPGEDTEPNSLVYDAWDINAELDEWFILGELTYHNSGTQPNTEIESVLFNVVMALSNPYTFHPISILYDFEIHTTDNTPDDPEASADTVSFSVNNPEDLLVTFTADGVDYLFLLGFGFSETPSLFFPRKSLTVQEDKTGHVYLVGQIWRAPVYPIPEPPTVSMSFLETIAEREGRAVDINNDGAVVVVSSGSSGIKTFLVVPSDNDGDGQPDTWFMDSNGDGSNDLMQEIGDTNNFTAAYAINDHYLVTGFYQANIGDYYRGFIWTPLDGFIDIGTSAETDNVTIPFDVNNNGLVVGNTAVLPTWGDPDARAFLVVPKHSTAPIFPYKWFEDANNDGTNDLMINLGSLGTDSKAFAISENGIICGLSMAADGRYHLFKIIPVDTNSDGVGDTWFRDRDPNDGKDINDLMIDLGGNFDDSLGARPYSIVDDGRGDAVIYGRTLQGVAFVHSPVYGFRYLNGLNDSVSSYALDSNAHGQVVGNYTSNDKSIAYLWTQSGMLELDEPLTDNSSSGAMGINASGDWIVGWGEAADGHRHAVIWRLLYNTNEGSSVSVTSDFGLDVAFDQVTQKGITTIVPRTDNPGLPLDNSLKVISPFFRVQTTAEFSGVTLELTQNAPGIDESTIQMQHCNNEVCEDITTSSSRIGDDVTIRGNTNSFSWFVLAVPKLITEPKGLESPLAALVPAGNDIVYPDKAFKQGRTLPLKLQLFSNDGSLLNDTDVPNPPEIISTQRIGEAPVMITIDLDAGDANDSGPYFRFTDGSWGYNLSTKNLDAGTYTITILMPDGRNFEAGFVLR